MSSIISITIIITSRFVPVIRHIYIHPIHLGCPYLSPKSYYYHYYFPIIIIIHLYYYFFSLRYYYFNSFLALILIILSIIILSITIIAFKIAVRTNC